MTTYLIEELRPREGWIIRARVNTQYAARQWLDANPSCYPTRVRPERVLVRIAW